MRKFLLAAITLLPTLVFSQLPKGMSSKSPLVNIYRISYKQAEKYILKDSIFLEDFINQSPYQQETYINYLVEDSLPTGNYIAVWLNGPEIVAEYFNKSHLNILPINNVRQWQIAVWDNDGKMAENAFVAADKQRVRYIKSSNTFLIEGKKTKESLFLKVYAPGDSTFATLEAEERVDYKDARKIYRRQTFLYKLIKFIPNKIKAYKYQRNSSRIKADGFVILNQPKYKIGDTVKFKAYIIDKKQKPFKEKLTVSLKYYAKGKYNNQKLFLLKPVSPGSYIGEFPIKDTLPMNTNCMLFFGNSNEKYVIQKDFKLEEYVLDETGKIRFEFTKQQYYINDTIKCTVSAEDANGLPLIGSKARVVITNSAIKNIFKDSLYVKDSLYDNEVKLLPDGTASFSLPSTYLPSANLFMEASLYLRNANNEVEKKSATCDYIFNEKDIVSHTIKDSLFVAYMENGIAVPKEANLSTVNADSSTIVQLPYKCRINPVVSEYSFTIAEGKNERTHTPKIDKYYPEIFFENSKDTLRFKIINPYKTNIFFSVLKNNKAIYTGSGTDSIITWERIMPNERQAYTLQYEWVRKGEVESRTQSLGLPYKNLNLKISSKPIVYPGQQDSLHVKVTDFKGRPAANVNLTAVSYNNQFAKEIRLPRLPYTGKYKIKNPLRKDGYEIDETDLSFTTYFPVSTKPNLIKKLAADTLELYQLLNPTDSFTDHTVPIHNFIPQVGVHIVKQGVPQEIYLLYINRKLVYYNGTTGKMPYAFEAYPMNVQFGIRLRDKYIEIDSIYLQPNYKHDLFFDIDRLPKNSRIELADTIWSSNEKNNLERSILRLENHPQNTYSYVWQDAGVTRIESGNNLSAGPFSAMPIKFFKPGSFDLEFELEPGYVYRLSPKTSRLEKIPMFDPKQKKHVLPIIKNAKLSIGDTLIAPPKIEYKTPEPEYVLREGSLKLRDLLYSNKDKLGKLLYFLPNDSVFCNIVVIEKSQPHDTIVLNRYLSETKLPEGSYDFYAATKHLSTLAFKNIYIKAGYSICIDMRKAIFDTISKTIYNIWKEQNTIVPELIVKPIEYTQAQPEVSRKIDIYDANGGSISGKVLDSKGGKPVCFASVVIKESGTGTQANVNGEYQLAKLKPGYYTITVSSTGYEVLQTKIYIDAQSRVMDFKLTMSSNSFEEVVVTSAFATTRVARSVSYNMQIISNNTLEGKVAGISVISQLEMIPGPNTLITLRGENSLNANGALPIYIIDGILTEDIKGLSPEEISEITVLSAVEGTSIYGSRASNGAIVITTKRKNFRQTFRDYAYWQPNFFTNNNGIAVVPIAYPDNITGWRSIVVGIDKKARVGQANMLVQSYKPITSQLYVPLFLLKGDKGTVINKITNYTTDDYSISSEITINRANQKSPAVTLHGRDAISNYYEVNAESSDTITVSVKSATTTGYKDGEERKMPILPIGTEEAKGIFSVMMQDSTIHFESKPNSKDLTIFASNNSLDILLDEISQLKKYPFWCMEQTASKMRGLLMEKEIMKQLEKPFTEEKTIEELMKKLLKAQQFDGGWAWWESGKSNIEITTYITRALLKLRNNPAVENAIRNAMLFLNNQLNEAKKLYDLETLYTLNIAGHQMDYASALKKVKLDSINSINQWQYVAICKKQNLPYKDLLKPLVRKGTYGILGGFHVGENNYLWYSNKTATTLVAFSVLKDEPQYIKEKQGIIQWFLENKSNGFWNNTVESAGILEAIVPELLAQKSDFNSIPTLMINGDTTLIAKKFPFTLKINNPKEDVQFNLSKKGGGMMYLTAYNTYFNSKPEATSNELKIATWFSNKTGTTVNFLSTGQQVTLNAEINADKEANYVMVEIPFPAGCIATNKDGGYWGYHKDYRKDKVYIFIEKLNEGKTSLSIDLEPRFTGTYTINPAKVSLMYFPTFFARANIKKIEIK